MTNLKLSQLADETEISLEESNRVYTVAELKREILELGEEHHLDGGWYTVTREKWHPSAEYMITNYIEQEQAEMYEDWGVQAIGHISDEQINQIQKILDSAFEQAAVTDYWKYDKLVEIDIFPVK